jgi:hypothetical protein
MASITINKSSFGATDDQLDRFVARMERAATEGVGFWITSGRRPYDPKPSDPKRGPDATPYKGPYHQLRTWVTPSDQVVLVYDRFTPDDSDRITF